MKHEISVIIPTYKRAQKLRAAIENLQKQSFKDFEIIVIDDNGVNSEEQLATQKVVNKLHMENLYYFPLERNSGAPFARNYGVSNCNGNYISFLDDDDSWESSKLEEQYSVLKNFPNNSFCYCNQILRTNKKNKLFKRLLYWGNIQEKIIQGNYIGSSSNPLINKKHFETVGGFDLQLPSCQDWDLWQRLIDIASPIFLNKPLVFIDRNPLERISSNKMKVLNGHIILFFKIKKKYQKHKFSLFIFRLKILKHLLSALFS